MITWHDVREELLQDPEVRREYEALRREELPRQEVLHRAEVEGKHPDSSTQAPRPAYA